VFPEAAEARQIKTKLVLRPSRTRWVWRGIFSISGYGITTPSPEQVGRTESTVAFGWRIGTRKYIA